MAFISVWMLYFVAQTAYWDYYFYPRQNRGSYIYPEWRYTIFDIGLLICGVVGATAAVLTLRSAARGAPFQGRPRRFTMSFLTMLVVLLTGTVVGSWLWSLGWR